MIKSAVRVIFPILGCVALASCGSSSGAGSSVVTGTVTPPPPQPIDYNTVEYRNNYGLAQINAIAAYENGATGSGITVAVIDSGIDIDHPQLEANIHVDSTNIVTGNKADLGDEDGHGSGVAGVVAAVRDSFNNSNVNTHGVAFDAKIMALNASSVGSCAGTDGCSFFDSDIAAALDYARTRGVKVVNISLGGDDYNTLELVNAYKRAVDAGMVIILAAGNEDDTDTAFDLSKPENSAAVAWESWANGQIILAGSVGQASVISDFSHLAGNVGKDVYLVAPGDSILSPGSAGDYFRWSGTSFSAPHIAGAAALLFDAFPNLTGKEVADLLFDTATDLGTAGADVVYGKGLINIAEAFSPQGSSSVAVKTATGETRVVALDGSVMLGGKAFGSFTGFSTALDNSLMLDSYDRSFRVDLGQKIFNPGDVIELESIIDSKRGSRRSSLQLDNSVDVDFSWQEDLRFKEVEENYFSHQNTSKNRHHNLRMKMAVRLSENQNMTFAQGLSLKETMEDYHQNEFLTIGKEDFTALVGLTNSQSAVFSQKLDAKSHFSLVVGRGDRQWSDYNLTANSMVMMARLDRKVSNQINLGVDLGVMSEKGSVLGSLSEGAVALGQGATTTFTNARFGWDISNNLNFFAKASFGVTNVKSAELSLIEQVSDLTSGSFSIGVKGNSLLQKGDRLSFAVSQPLRVMGGHANISYVTARDYSQDYRFGGLAFSQNQVSLSPNGREIDFELVYRMANLFGAQVDFNFLHQMNPNHDNLMPDNTGFLIRFGSEF